MPFDQQRYSKTLSYKQGFYQEYYDEKIAQIQEYFALRGYDCADAFFEVLLQRKVGLVRKEGYSPDYSHEIDQLLARISAIESGQIDVEAFEKQYGSLEAMLIAVIVHDLGEDFGMMPEDLEALVMPKLRDRRGNAVDDRHYYFVQRGCQSMERLTHDRHYSIQEFDNKFGDSFEAEMGKTLNIPVPGPGETIALPPEIGYFLWRKMDVLETHKSENFQAFIRLDKKGQPKITVTRYGVTKGFGASWDCYMGHVAEDPIDGPVKNGDSANGMTSRLSILSFTVLGYARYLNKRNQIINNSDIIWRMSQSFPEMQNDIESVGGMMGLFYMLGNSFVIYHPDSNQKGESQFCVHQAPKDKDGVMHINPCDFFDRAFRSYEFTPGISHPIGRYMQQFRDVLEMYEGTEFYDDFAELYKQTRAVLIKHGGEWFQQNGLNIETLIDAPWMYDPMPDLLKELRRGQPQISLHATTLALES